MILSNRLTRETGLDPPPLARGAGAKVRQVGVVEGPERMTRKLGDQPLETPGTAVSGAPGPGRRHARGLPGRSWRPLSRNSPRPSPRCGRPGRPGGAAGGPARRPGGSAVGTGDRRKSRIFPGRMRRSPPADPGPLRNHSATHLQRHSGSAHRHRPGLQHRHEQLARVTSMCRKRSGAAGPSATGFIIAGTAPARTAMSGRSSPPVNLRRRKRSIP